MWYERDLGQALRAPSLPARVIVGPRQAGKSSLLYRSYPDAEWLSLDDLSVRVRAERDPGLLLDGLGLETGRAVVLDEAAYAPNLFPEIKRRIDLARRHGSVEPSIFITGSNRLLLDRSVRESLAGRASYHFLHSLSVAELGAAATLPDWHFRGGWPELYVRRELDPVRYLADYVRTFVEKDIAATAGVERVHEFQLALGLLAARTGTLLNASDVGQLAGVKGQTISGWLDLLEQNALALRLKPYHSNLNKRLVRTPKLYVLDTGLAAYLQGWQVVEPLLASPQAGPLFETLVLGELVRARDHRGLSLSLFFWRTKEGEELDFLVRAQGRRGPRWLALEAKLAVQNVSPVTLPKSLARELPELRDVWVITPGGSEARLSDGCLQVPIPKLADRLVQALDGS
jgi:predicted AAA+ superfamily ATPase